MSLPADACVLCRNSPTGPLTEYYHVEDIPLTLLAGYRRAPGAPNMRTMQPHELPGPKLGPNDDPLEGQALELDTGAASAFARWQAPRAMAMGLREGHVDPTANAGVDTELTAWLDYNPRWAWACPLARENSTASVVAGLD